MSETWYRYQKKEEGKHHEVKLIVVGEPTAEQHKQMIALMKDGYVELQRFELGQTKKCKDNIV